MNATTIQLLSLITYGNHFLETQQLPNDYYPAHAAFNFCNNVNFLHLDSYPDETPVEYIMAPDPAAWFVHLQEGGCTALKAYYQPSEGNELNAPDYKLAGLVGGGGIWLIETIYPSYSDFWASRWEVARQSDSQPTIWSVSYGRTISGAPTVNFSPDVRSTQKAFGEILKDIEAFASRHKLTEWVTVFRNASAVLHNTAQPTEWHLSLIEKTGYNPAALQLIFAAFAAHVFGGMGSWNDLRFDTAADNQDYDRLSFWLYDWLNRALVSGINAKRAVVKAG